MSAVYHSLAAGTFSQDWSDTGLISADGNWDNVPSIVGYRGDGLTGGTGTDPRTITTTSAVVNVEANETNPGSFATGGVAEFQIADPTIALNGSGTADAPYIVLHLDASGREDIAVSFNLRDLDGSADDAQMQVAVQYRTDNGAWINVPGGYVADATTGGAATLVTPVSVVLPAAANNAATLQVRVITTNAAGNDEWVGIDDIVVTSDAVTVGDPGILSVADASVAEGDGGATALTFTVSRNGGDTGAVSATWTIDLDGNADAADLDGGQPLTGSVNFADGQTSATIIVQIAGDADFEPSETFSLTLSAPTGGATLGDATATGTIQNDDAAPPAGDIFINEIHYDDAGADIGEAIEIAGPAGYDLTGWTLVKYNGNGGVQDGAAIALGGTFPSQDGGFGTLSFSLPGLQNGSPDGIALVDAGGNVIQFLSWEGSFLATNGPAAGLTSTDIGVAEEPAPADGFSLQLVGAGATYEDFHWVDARDDSFGAVNQDQDFIGGSETGLVSVADVALVEGDAGETLMTFTISRAGGLDQEAAVDWQLVTDGTANGLDFTIGAPTGGFVTFGVGVARVQVTLSVAGDTIGENNETFSVQLSDPIGNIAIVDGVATGTILNDDPIPLRVYEIQGEAHRSAVEGQPVITNGIVTAVVSNGFYLQDPTGDGNARTSDGIFVFTGAAPAVAVGDAVEVTGDVAEFLPGGDPTNLTVTEIDAGPAGYVVQSSGNAVPAALVIGTGGVLPPTEIIDNDGFTLFDPEQDGIDFYETLEGMLVTIDAPLVVHNSTSQFGETFVVASGGDGATSVNARGGITISDGDQNPERIQIVAGDGQVHTQGDRLADVTGIMSYGFEHYRVLVTEEVVRTVDVTVGQETTTLEGGRDHLTVASYNLQNLGPNDTPQKFDLLAKDIVLSLKAPDIIAVQEMQDGNGLNGSDPLSAEPTAQLLIDAIAANGGPGYIYVEIAPATAGSTGGEPGGNIRNGYFYNPDRVSLVEGSLALITDPAFDGSRKPLVGTFTFNGEQVTLIDVHFTARLGGPPAWGADQPAADAGDGARTAQASAVRAYVNDQLATDPGLKLGVLGDFNGFWFENAVAALEAGGVMTDLSRLLPEAERYSARFDGNLQGIDHIVTTGGLLDGASFDIVHRNAEQPFFVEVGTDHDPVLARFFIEAPNEAPVGANDAIAVDEDAASGNLWSLLLGNDSDPDPEDVLAIAAVDTGGTLGSLVFDPNTQSLVYVADNDAFDALAPGATIVDSFSYTVTDPDGLTSTATVQVTVTGIADGVVRTGGNRDDILLGTGGEDQLSGNNGDDTLLGGLGHDLLNGGNHDDRLFGEAGNDVLNGGNHEDLLDGGAGNDVLIGGNHKDVLNGGAGDDVLTGGNHDDRFVFTETGGDDRITDFDRGDDRIDLSDLDAVEGGGHDAFSWIGANAFSGTAGELRSFASGGAFFLAGDVDGDGAADFTIQTDVAILQGDVMFG